MEKVSLNGLWQGRCYKDGTSFNFPAQVPGSSINDLMSFGVLPKDIFYGSNADKVAKYERCDFEFKKSFRLKRCKNERYTLTFERLDTYCKVYVNGEAIATTVNGLIKHSFDVTDVLRDGENRIKVCFKSPITAVENMKARNGAFTTERLNTRRIQCTYGWDWVARFVGCGISGNVELSAHTTDEMIIDSAYIRTKDIDSESAGMVIDLNFPKTSADGVITLLIKSPEGDTVRQVSRYCNEELVRFYLDIPSPKLWYPRGYGKQPLYTLSVLDKNGTDIHNERFGIRTVKIMQLPDKKNSEAYRKCDQIKNETFDRNEDYSGFILKVNGEKILCRGANYVPSEPFCHMNTDEKITELLLRACDMGLNMIRVWGGGAFESEHFYDECSRLGIMVTQDFLMACGNYPEDEDWFIEQLGYETEYAAKLIRNKPCLMWWSGDNENATRGCDTDKNYTGRRAAYFGIAKVLYALDPDRAFLPSSPYGGNMYASNTVGTTHNTNFLGTIFPYMMHGDYENYREFFKKYRARFIAEEPQLGAISEGSIKKFMTDKDIYGDDLAMWNYHTKSNPALKDSIFDMTLAFAEGLLGKFTSPEDRFFKLRYLQYEWVRLSMEQLRREMWFCSGLIYWMLNDCWPASSGWAIIDYYNKPKDAYYAFKRCSGRVTLSFDNENGKYQLYASNAGATVKGARATVHSVKGKRKTKIAELELEIPKARSTVIFELDQKLRAGETFVATITAEGIYDRTFFKNGALHIEKTDLEVTLDKEAKTVTLKADGYVHAIELEGDAIFEDNCFSLLPKEKRTISYEPISDTEITYTAYTY